MLIAGAGLATENDARARVMSAVYDFIVIEMLVRECAVAKLSVSDGGEVVAALIRGRQRELFILIAPK